jgi:hypothetical protein
MPELEVANAIKATLFYVDPKAPIGAHNDKERDKSTLTVVPHDVTIRDARAIRKDLSLDRTGFVLLNRQSKVRDFYDPAEVERIFLPEVEAMIGELTGAERVLTFGTVVRNDNPDAPDWTRKSVNNAHVDYDLKTCRAVAERLLPAADRARYASGRIILINVWRPIVKVESKPIALCDAATVSPDDLIFGPIGGKSQAGVPDAAGYNIAYNPKHRWYYVPRMRPDELLAFRLCDSRADLPQWTAHTSFVDPGSPPNAKPRQSIELRTLALFPAA